MSIVGIEPAIWRRVCVPDAYSLHQLHRVFQLLFGWQDYHLYDFHVGERRFEEPKPEAEHESTTKAKLHEFRFEAGTTFIYTYDYGDNWTHEVLVEDVYPATSLQNETRLPALLGGERAGPHEDSGGPLGYGEMVKALRNRRNEKHQMYREWTGPLYDPERFDAWLLGQNLVLAAAWGAI